MDLTELLAAGEDIATLRERLESSAPPTVRHRAEAPEEPPPCCSSLGEVTTLGGTNAGSGFCEDIQAFAVARTGEIDVVDTTGRTLARLECESSELGTVVAWAKPLLAAATRGAIFAWRFEAWPPSGRGCGPAASFPRERSVVALAWSASFLLAACAADLVEIFDDELRVVASVPGGGWRGCAWAADQLCIVGGSGAVVWDRRRGVSAIDGCAGARCATGLSAGFAVVCDAPLRLFPREEDAIRESNPPIIRPARRPVGEVTFSGFGGGEIPAAFLLSKPSLEALEPPAPTLALVVASPDGWRVDRRTPIDASFGTIVDLVAAGGDSHVFVASTFSASVAAYDSPAITQCALAQVPDLAGRRCRLRGLVVSDARPLALFAADDGQPRPFVSPKTPRAETLFVADALFPRFFQQRETAPTSPTTQAPQDDGQIRELRAYVDHRLDRVEAKLDLLLDALATSRTPPPQNM